MMQQQQHQNPMQQMQQMMAAMAQGGMPGMDPGMMQQMMQQMQGMQGMPGMQGMQGMGPQGMQGMGMGMGPQGAGQGQGQGQGPRQGESCQSISPVKPPTVRSPGEAYTQHPCADPPHPDRMRMARCPRIRRPTETTSSKRTEASRSVQCAWRMIPAND